MIACLILIIFGLGDFISLPVPEGWTFPKHPDFNQEWRNGNPDRYLSCRGDFNGDGTIDSAFVLESKGDANFGVFVEFSTTNDKKELVMLFDFAKTFHHIDKMHYEGALAEYRSRYGIKVVSPDSFNAAFEEGKQEYTDSKSEKYELLFPGIELFEYDAGYSEFYYWDLNTKKFV